MVQWKFPQKKLTFSYNNCVAISAGKFYEELRRQAASLKIQKNFRCYIARKSYLTLQDSAVTVQTGMRAMIARTEFRFRKQTKASIKIQVFVAPY